LQATRSEKLEIRRRKFYATRHTFISWALTEGMYLKALLGLLLRRTRSGGEGVTLAARKKSGAAVRPRKLGDRTAARSTA
jgi:hypothetical protein